MHGRPTTRFWGPAHCTRSDCGRCLIVETRAFLTATAADEFARRGVDVPPWAWLNRIAHAEPETVLHTALGPTSEGCGGLIAFLAREVVVTARGDPAGIADIQRRVLVPLELELLSKANVEYSPSELAIRVLDGLDEREAHRSNR